MNFYHQVSSLSQNDPNGIMNSCMAFNLSDIIDQDKPIYIYKYNASALVEVICGQDSIKVITFYDSKFGAQKCIESDLDFFFSYFESAKLKNKRFLFDVELKVPVSYSDFQEMETFDLSERKNIPFIFDRTKEHYICEPRTVNVFLTTTDAYLIDNAILSVYQNYKCICGVLKSSSPVGTMSTSAIFGMFNNIDPEKLQTQIMTRDFLATKFWVNLSAKKVSSKYVHDIMKPLKINKLFEIFYDKSFASPMEEFSDEAVNLSRIIEIGLDNFLQFIKNSKKVIGVNLDTPVPGLNKMRITNGAAFVEVNSLKSLHYLKELLESDNVCMIAPKY